MSNNWTGGFLSLLFPDDNERSKNGNSWLVRVPSAFACPALALMDSHFWYVQFFASYPANWMIPALFVSMVRQLGFDREESDE